MRGTITNEQELTDNIFSGELVPPGQKVVVLAMSRDEALCLKKLVGGVIRPDDHSLVIRPASKEETTSLHAIAFSTCDALMEGLEDT